MAVQDQQPLLAPKRGLYIMTNKTGNEAHRILSHPSHYVYFFFVVTNVTKAKQK